MRKTGHGSNFDHATPEDRTLDDAELNAVTGGKPGTVSESLSLPYEEIKFKYTEQKP